MVERSRSFPWIGEQQHFYGCKFPFLMKKWSLCTRSRAESALKLKVGIPLKSMNDISESRMMAVSAHCPVLKRDSAQTQGKSVVPSLLGDLNAKYSQNDVLKVQPSEIVSWYKSDDFRVDQKSFPSLERCMDKSRYNFILASCSFSCCGSDIKDIHDLIAVSTKSPSHQVTRNWLCASVIVTFWCFIKSVRPSFSSP